MSSRRYAATLSVFGMTAALGACDPQASPFFRGDSLLTVHGSVTISDDHTDGKLAPALGFVNRQNGEMQILEVDVQGKFPSDFRIDVFTPPNAETLQRLTDFGADEPPTAMGYITAVTDDHPDSFQFGTTGSETVSASRGTVEQKWCADPEETTCYIEKQVCPSENSPAEDCHIERSGDPAIKEPMWRFFAGFSQNYVVAYLSEPARAGSGTAAVLGASDGLGRGYHLLKVREYDDDLQEQYYDCQARSEQHALDSYNAAEHTNYAQGDVDPAMCALGPGPGCMPGIPGCEYPPKPAFCDLPSPEQDVVFEALRVGAMRAQVALGCLVSQFEPVDNVESTSIAIEIAPNAAPRFGPNEEPVF